MKYRLLIPLIAMVATYIITNAITIQVVIASKPPLEGANDFIYGMQTTTEQVHPINPLLASIIVGIVSFVIVFFVARKLK